ncbi:efflux RND transporter periplasmic adaptor subunit [Hanstruepera ponticola]|uniref:efflux RND transporter periplasmic adaptor subunit n=1 Tax=Hanstruepera ponticola TaxID=2042995 RepID=UPI000CF13296|nr:efflux RND transporter periplasmic adaptor subunit [Hanstruepera ponticola]
MKLNKHYKVLVILTLGILVSCGKKEAPKKEVLRPVKYAEVKYSGADKIRHFSGTAKTEKIINLSFRNTGIIVMLNMKLGQKVKKGDLLAQLDNVQARLNYESSIESRNSTESQMNTAKLNLNRVRTLYEKGSSSLSDYEAAKNSYRTAVASFESAKRSVSIQAEQIKFGYLYAPEDGAIASVIAEVDENVSPGQTIGVLNAGTAIEIEIGLPESVINNVHKGMNVKVAFSAIDNKQYDAKVTEVAPALDSNTSTYPIRVTITEEDERIKSGMAASVTFEFATSQSEERKLVIPPVSVGENGNDRFVFLIEESEGKHVIKRQQVTIGELTAEGFEIESGLQEGQKIATAGLQTLLDGQKVKLN